MRQDDFFAFAESLCTGLQAEERLFVALGGETSSFVRVNGARVRQAGSVERAGLGLTLIDGPRQAEAVCDLSGERELDLKLARDLIGRLRERLPYVPEDPYLDYSRDPWASERLAEAAPPDAQDCVSELLDAAVGLDLVGIWASGEIVEGLASSLGHRHWHASASFNLDWSAYLKSDKAVKASYGGFAWDPQELARKLRAQRDGLAVMAREPHSLKPGRYRAYLAPAAVEELMGMLAWGGFDLKSHRTRQTPLLKLALGERALDPRVTFREEQSRGLCPGFTGEGFPVAPTVSLIEGGRFGRCLVDARDGKEYGEPVNAAGGAPESVALAAGDIQAGEILSRLGSGIYVGNLWYCNWSDPNDCRVTGMTRFGTYWVENGEIAAPLAVMRFDDSLYHLLGDRLEGLAAERDLMLSAETYEGRSTASALLPGILVSGIELTL